MIGRDVIFKGLEMQFGSGESISFIANSGQVMNINQLIATATRSWDEQKIEEHCPREMQAFLNEGMFSIFGGGDKIVWKFTNTGQYSVKSGYEVLSNTALDTEGW